jgi:hypothetical protein
MCGISSQGGMKFGFTVAALHLYCIYVIGLQRSENVEEIHTAAFDRKELVSV